MTFAPAFKLPESRADTQEKKEEEEEKRIVGRKNK